MNKKSKIFLGVIIILFILTMIPATFLMGAIEQMVYDKAPEEAVKLSELTLQRIDEGKKSEIIESFAKDIKEQENINQILGNVVDFVDEKGIIKKVTMVGYHASFFGENETHKISYEVQFEERVLEYHATLIKEGGKYKLYRTDFREISAPLKELVAFSFKDKGIIHIGFLFFYIVIIVFTFYTAALCFGNTKKHKWRRSIFILFGIGSITLNWTTGQLFGNLITFHIPAAVFMRAGTYVPYVISLKFPLGAIIYWLKWRKEEIELPVDEIEGVAADVDACGEGHFVVDDSIYVGSDMIVEDNVMDVEDSVFEDLISYDEDQLKL